MRWIFLTVIVLLFELFTYGAGRGCSGGQGLGYPIGLLAI